MSVFGRRKLAVVLSCALVTACNDPAPSSDHLEAQWASEEQVRTLRRQMFDAMGTRSEGRELEKWLARPETCSASNFVTRLEMAAGTFVWPDVPQYRGEENRDFEFLRDMWLDFVVSTLDTCAGYRVGPIVRRYQREIGTAFATPRAQRAIERLLNGTEKEQRSALKIIELAPNRVYYERVAQLARTGSVFAESAMLSIDGLWTDDDVSAEWVQWLESRLDDTSASGLKDLLAVAVGTAPPGGPNSQSSVAVRRAAARRARVWRDTTLDGRSISDDRILQLAKDPDDIVRREGVDMLEGTVENADLLLMVATNDTDERTRLIAYRKLPEWWKKKVAGRPN